MEKYITLDEVLLEIEKANSEGKKSIKVWLKYSVAKELENMNYSIKMFGQLNKFSISDPDEYEITWE